MDEMLKLFLSGRSPTLDEDGLSYQFFSSDIDFPQYSSEEALKSKIDNNVFLFVAFDGSLHLEAFREAESFAQIVLPKNSSLQDIMLWVRSLDWYGTSPNPS